MDWLAARPDVVWLIAGGVLLVLEMVGASGIGLLFLGLSALTVGCVVYAGWLDIAAIGWQWGWFLILSALWAAILWKPMRRVMKRRGEKPSYQNMLGTEAKVLASGLQPGVESSVRWSGTVMRARLADGQKAQAEGAVVRVEAVDGNVLVVIAAE